MCLRLQSVRLNDDGELEKVELLKVGKGLAGSLLLKSLDHWSSVPELLKRPMVHSSI